MLATIILSALFFTQRVSGHVGAYAPGMYCRNGPQSQPNYNSNDVVLPLYQLPVNQWWMHANNKCNQYPPPDGEYLEVKAGGDLVVELSGNQGQTTLSFGGKFTSDWPDGQSHPDNMVGDPCIYAPNLHTQNQSMAAGTVFAISYESDITAVTPENLAVFTVAYHTPWKRVTTYKVPALMPPCPPKGCHCVWGWVPNGCGIPNMYMQPFKCTVTGSTSTKSILPAKPPVWCEDDPSKCVKGAKQMLYWNQLEGNNIKVSGWDLHGDPKSPAYNAKCGFSDGAQNDIFGDSSNSPSPSSASMPSPSSRDVLAGIPQSSGTPSSGTPSSSTPSSSPPASTATPSTSLGSPSSSTPSLSPPASTATPAPSGTPNPDGQCKSSGTNSGRTYTKKSSIARGLAMHRRRLDRSL